MNTFIVGAIINLVSLGTGVILGVLLNRKSGGSKPPDITVPPKDTIEKIVKRAIELHELGRTTQEIIEEMDNLPEYEP